MIRQRWIYGCVTLSLALCLSGCGTDDDTTGTPTTMDTGVADVGADATDTAGGDATVADTTIVDASAVDVGSVIDSSSVDVSSLIDIGTVDSGQVVDVGYVDSSQLVDVGSLDIDQVDAGAADASTGDTTATDAAATINCYASPPVFPVFDKSCKTAADCGVVLHQINCCGTFVAAAVSVSAQADFAAAEKTCEAQYPKCKCMALPTKADDGKTAVTIDEFGATCEAGTCKSLVK